MYRKGIEPDFNEALIVRNNSTIEDVCDAIHRTLKDSFKYALVWGQSARHVPQRVGLGHVVLDEDSKEAARPESELELAPWVGGCRRMTKKDDLYALDFLRRQYQRK